MEDSSAQDAAAAAALALEARLETAGQPAAVFVEGGLLLDAECVATAEAATGAEGAAAANAAPVRPGTKGIGRVASARVRSSCGALNCSYLQRAHVNMPGSKPGRHRGRQQPRQRKLSVDWRHHVQPLLALLCCLL